MIDEPLRLPNGNLLYVSIDEHPKNPLDAENDAGLAYCWHRRYNLGHYRENNYSRPQELLDELFRRRRVKTIGQLEDKGFLFVPLYLLDHSGLAMSTRSFNDPWDSGQVGWWVLSPKEIRREWRGDRVQARAYVEGEIERYSDYLGGAVYGYVIKDAFGAVVDSCGGFYGHDHERSGLYEAAGYDPAQKLTQENNSLCSTNST